MSMPTNDAASAPSKQRRKVIAGLGIGLCAGAVALNRWWPTESSGISSSVRTNSGRASLPARPLPDVGTNPEAYTKLSRDWFATCRNTEFRMETGVTSSGTAVRLIEVSAAETTVDRRSNTTYTSFSLVFDGPREMKSEAGVYQLKHDKLGTLEMFLSPIEKHAELTRYEAVFSQRV